MSLCKKFYIKLNKIRLAIAVLSLSYYLGKTIRPRKNETLISNIFEGIISIATNKTKTNAN